MLTFLLEFQTWISEATQPRSSNAKLVALISAVFQFHGHQTRDTSRKLSWGTLDVNRQRYGSGKGGALETNRPNGSYSYSNRVPLRGISEESCSVISLSEKMAYQLRLELCRRLLCGEQRSGGKFVPDDRSRDGENSLSDGRVCPRNEQVVAASRTEWPTQQVPRLGRWLA